MFDKMNRRKDLPAPRMRRRRGQAMVEFAMISPVLMVIVALAVQFAIIAQSALALSELASASAEYAAQNESADQTAVTNYVKSAASPSLMSNGGADLSVVLSPTATPRTPGTSVTVSISYITKSKIILPNPFLGVSLPASLTDAGTAMGE
jgi:Flp pilus assembly protein TadG